MTCQTCKHWKLDVCGTEPEGWGTCKRAYAEDSLAAPCSYDHLNTAPTFGCNQFEVKA